LFLVGAARLHGLRRDPRRCRRRRPQPRPRPQYQHLQRLVPDRLIAKREEPQPLLVAGLNRCPLRRTSGPATRDPERNVCRFGRSLVTIRQRLSSRNHFVKEGSHWRSASSISTPSPSLTRPRRCSLDTPP